jgi:aspartate racemase
MDEGDGDCVSVFTAEIVKNAIPCRDVLGWVLQLCENESFRSRTEESVLDIQTDVEWMLRCRGDLPVPSRIAGVMYRLGICGGMGPVAGASFALDLCLLLKGERTVYWGFFMFSNPLIEAYKEGSVWPSLSAARLLNRFIGYKGFHFTCVPSNTAHLVWAMKTPPASLVSIFDAVAEEMVKLNRGIIGERQKLALGFMSTDVSLEYFGYAYGPVLKRKGIRVVTLDAKMQRICAEGIAMVKNEALSRSRGVSAKSNFCECASWLRAQGAGVIVMACTEIPLELRPGDVGASSTLVLLDSSHCLALAVYDRLHVLSLGSGDRQV